MRRTWFTGFVAGCLTTALLLLALGVIPGLAPAEAQSSELERDQLRIMRDMADSLAEIERAIRDRCP